MTVYVPRFRGNAVPFGTHWGWELFITIGDGEPITMVNKKDLFLNRSAALADLKKRLPEIMKMTCEAAGLGTPEGVQDLNKGTVETVDEWSRGPIVMRDER